MAKADQGRSGEKKKLSHKEGLLVMIFTILTSVISAGIFAPDFIRFCILIILFGGGAVCLGIYSYRKLGYKGGTVLLSGLVVLLFISLNLVGPGLLRTQERHVPPTPRTPQKASLETTPMKTDQGQSEETAKLQAEIAHLRKEMANLKASQKASNKRQEVVSQPKEEGVANSSTKKELVEKQLCEIAQAYVDDMADLLRSTTDTKELSDGRVNLKVKYNKLFTSVNTIPLGTPKDVEEFATSMSVALEDIIQSWGLWIEQYRSSGYAYDSVERLTGEVSRKTANLKRLQNGMLRWCPYLVIPNIR